MNKVLKEMIRIYKPENKDWMGYKLNKKNPYTYHHIFKKVYGDFKTIDNGAILTVEAHELLHYLEQKDFESYRELNRLFRELNATRQPPTREYYKEIHKVLKKGAKNGSNK